LFDHLVKHLGTTSVAEVVMQLVGADEQILTFHADSLQWLADTQLLELILESLAAEHSSAVHANAAEVLTAIARTLPSSLANQLGSPIYLQRLFQHTQAPGFGCQVRIPRSLPRSTGASILHVLSCLQAHAVELSHCVDTACTIPVKLSELAASQPPSPRCEQVSACTAGLTRMRRWVRRRG
jgi:hypothetical protein